MDMNRRRYREASLRTFEPFLKEYDFLLRYILTEVQHFKNEIKALRKEALILVANNRSLHRDLRRQVEQNLASDPPHSNQLLRELQSHLDTVTEDKNITSKMLQTALQEIERLENQLEEKKDFVDRDTLNQSVEKVRTDYENRYEETFRELEKTKCELFEAQKSLHNTKLRLARYSEPVYVIENELQEKEKKLDEVLQCLQETQEKLILAEEERTDAISRLAAVEARLNKYCTESANHSQELKSCQDRSKALQEQLSSALEHAEESVNITERALLEKQEAQLRCELLENEVMELRTSLEAVVEEAAQHTANEVDKFREKGNQRIKELIKQIGQLQQAVQQQQSLTAHLSEENSRLREETGMLQKRQADLRLNRDPAFQALSQTLMQAERMCQKHRLTAESLQDKLLHQEKQSTFKVKQRELEIQRLQNLLQEAEKRADQLQQSMVETEDQTAELRRKAHTLEAECIALRKRHPAEVTALTEALDQEKIVYSMKLQQMQDTFEKKLMNAQALLQAQQAVNDKWKTEASRMASEFETELLAARKKISALKKANMEWQRKAYHTAKETRKEKRTGHSIHQERHGSQVKQSATMLQERRTLSA
ncbi:sodium channel and clathrin linker 1 [Rhipicephalus sanguineus]|uniref:sodium channel and clathrin linker 1 n=1 Tax=Rhipicephalus sanguineus TaxID=34632 RepID=UPI0018961DFC|nr:sodium channel and clathrin linker 1 [Rhipicephalus sanguineus]